MNNDYAKVILDSIGPNGKRAVTVEMRYWRAIHAEIMTHRDRARNAASSRAIPFYREAPCPACKGGCEKCHGSGKDRKTAIQIQGIKGTAVRQVSDFHYEYAIPNCTYSMISNDPFLPEFVGTEQKGMQSGGELVEPQRTDFLVLADHARLSMLGVALEMYKTGVHKSLINRYLEPWSYITVVMTATEWKNFFRLRVHPKAEKHFQKVAGKVKAAIEASVPRVLAAGDWHMPYMRPEDLDEVFVPVKFNDREIEQGAGNMVAKLKRVSAARCARLSYLTQDGVRDQSKDLGLFETLIHPKIDEDRDDDVIHSCYDAETDVLTSQGWKPWPKVKGDEEFCTLNLDTKTVHYQKATATHLGKPYKGRMVEAKSQYMSLLVTPNHNMVTCVMTTRQGRKKEDFKLYPASGLEKINHCYMKAGHQEYEKQGHYSYDTLALLGFALGDGHVPRRGDQLTFHLRKDRKIEYLRSLAPEIRELSDGVFAMPYPFDFDIYDEDRKKTLLQSVLMGEDNYPIYEGMMNSDGSEDYTYSTNSEKLKDAFCQICVHLSFAFAVRQYRGVYQISVNKAWTKPEFNRTLDYKSKIKVIEDWEGDVYCVTVPNQTLYVRRKGVGVWSGNSPLEHVLQASNDPELRSGPMSGWFQFRKEFANENVPG